MSRSGFNLIRESALNLASRPTMTAIVGVAALAFGFLTVAFATAEVGTATAQQQQMVDRGYNVWRVQSEQGLSVERCDGLRLVSGVRDSGALLSQQPATMDEVADAGVTLLEATPGFIRIVWPGSDPLVSVGVGDELASSVGLRAGMPIHVRANASSDGANALKISTALPATVRLPGANQVVVAARPVLPDSVKVRECLVESAPGARDSVGGFLLSAFGGDAQVTPLFVESTVGRSPEAQLRGRFSQWVPLVGGVAVAILAAMSQFVRRSDWTLYRLMGVSPAGRLLMVSVEVAATVIVPFAAGVLAALIAMSPSIYDPAVARAIGQDAVRALAVLVLTPLLTVLVLHRRDPLAWLRGE